MIKIMIKQFSYLIEGYHLHLVKINKIPLDTAPTFTGSVVHSSMYWNMSKSKYGLRRAVDTTFFSQITKSFSSMDI
jgi:hypothetical protein